jgi:seryl-tRNA synthetase
VVIPQKIKKEVENMSYIEELTKEIEQGTAKMKKLNRELKEIKEDMDRKIQALKLLEGKNAIKRKAGKDKVPSRKAKAVQREGENSEAS